MRLPAINSETTIDAEDIDRGTITESLVKESKKFINMSRDRYLSAG